MENVTVARSCARCGSSMEAEDRFCQGCGAPAASTTGRLCRRCGGPLGPSARFCPQCGARAMASIRGSPVGDWVERVRSRLPADIKTRVARVALPVAALLLALATGYWLGRRSVSAAPGESPLASVPPGGREVEPQRSPPIRFRDFTITASSWEYAHPPVHAADGDPYTFWHAWETERHVTGDWLTLTFPEERVVSRIGVLPGRLGRRARADGRVRSVLVKAPGAAPQKLIFDDRPRMQHRDLDRPVRTRTLILRIATVLPGYRSSQILVPEVQVWGYRSPSRMAHANEEVRRM